MIAPFKRKRRTIAVDPGIRDLFQLIKSDAWPPMMEKHLGLDPGSYPTAVPSKPPVPGHVPPRRTRTAEAPSTPSNTQGPSVCGNCQCFECHGPPCLSIIIESASILQQLWIPSWSYIYIYPMLLRLYSHNYSKQCHHH